MSLVFGNLTEQFVIFGTILNEVQEGLPGAAEQVPGAAANFRRVAAKDAGYLALIGELSRSFTPKPLLRTFIQASGYSFALSLICAFGCTPEK